ncbi:MAG: hypothetical protein FJ298_07715 [Planctomycetes bacterium]|nr:hypothetical protein [Planctomycetota bacterium]
MDRKLLNRLKFHLDRAIAGSAGEDDWDKIVAALEALLPQAPDAGTREVARLLKVDASALRSRRLPSDYGRIVKELGDATRRPASTARAEPSMEERAAALVRGRALLVLGGDRRREHERRLQETLELSQAIWPPTKEDAPDVEAFEPLIARPDVVAVVLLIRWSRHAFGKTSELCERHSKPLVRVEAGYNVAQIARAIVEQASKRLGGE